MVFYHLSFLKLHIQMTKHQQLYQFILILPFLVPSMVHYLIIHFNINFLIFIYYNQNLLFLFIHQYLKVYYWILDQDVRFLFYVNIQDHREFREHIFLLFSQ